MVPAIPRIFSVVFSVFLILFFIALTSVSGTAFVLKLLLVHSAFSYMNILSGLNLIIKIMCGPPVFYAGFCLALHYHCFMYINKDSTYTQTTMERNSDMTQNNTISRMYFAVIIEENEEGFHRESLWYGGSPENLGLTIIDVMKDWYEPYKDRLDESIVKYHTMLENKDELTFDMISGEGFNADGMKIYVDISNDLSVMFAFILSEICNIYAKEGETPASFEGLSQFKKHFVDNYNIDEGFQDVLDTVNEVTVSKALVLIDMKYNYTGRHFRCS